MSNTYNVSLIMLFGYSYPLRYLLLQYLIIHIKSSRPKLLAS